MGRALATLLVVAAMIAPGAALAATPCPERVLEDGCCEREPAPNATIAGLCCCSIRELPGAVAAHDAPALAPDRDTSTAVPALLATLAWQQPIRSVLHSQLPKTARAPPAATLFSLHTSLIC